MTRFLDWFRDLLSEFSGSLSPDTWSIFGINFAHPAFLLLLLLLPIWSWWRRRAAPQRAIPFSRAAVLGQGPQPSLSWVRWLPWLRSLALAGFIIAAAQPRSSMPLRSASRPSTARSTW